ncbi:hypothetical protein Cme02nite_31980 [Catellatospora methionotrophica]|uniref:Uncharacterized protein n=1 Tax=Catellatospora methionotrophica TaxID=121620 RepID=A0A8J3PEQ7_9ACTN|nr:hypothetical protein Cme02nite_31980 [Catellatospora methionotrophica]
MRAADADRGGGVGGRGGQDRDGGEQDGEGDGHSATGVGGGDGTVHGDSYEGDRVIKTFHYTAGVQTLGCSINAVNIWP